MHKSVTRMKRHQLKSLLRWVFPSFKPHPAILTAIFAFTAAFSFMAETIMGTFSDRVMEPSSTIVLLVLMVSLALCGIFPPYFESLFILLSSIYFGLFGSLTTPTLGIYVTQYANRSTCFQVQIFSYRRVPNQEGIRIPFSPSYILAVTVDKRYRRRNGMV